MENNKDIWFPAKKYGVGWGLPVAWQGWVVLAVFVLLMVGGVLVLTASPQRVAFLPPYAVALVVGLIFICWKKGEKVAFRWGKRK